MFQIHVHLSPVVDRSSVSDTCASLTPLLTALLFQIHVHLSPVPSLDDHSPSSHHRVRYGRVHLLHRRYRSCPPQDHESSTFQLHQKRHNLHNPARTDRSKRRRKRRGRGLRVQLHLVPGWGRGNPHLNRAGPRLHGFPVLAGSKLLTRTGTACHVPQPDGPCVHAPSQRWAGPDSRRLLPRAHQDGEEASCGVCPGPHQVHGGHGNYSRDVLQILSQDVY